MTRHENEDTLLELALGLLNAADENRVRRHLQECSECRQCLADVERSLQLIKEAGPEVSADIPVLPPRVLPLPLLPQRVLPTPSLPTLATGRYAWLRVAAMLAVGFGLGILVSESSRPPSVTVVRQQIVPKAPDLPAVEFVACDGDDLSFISR